jgi:hypothetical protein
MRAFDQPRDISDGRAAVVVQLNDADARPESREWVRRHLRMRRRQLAEQRRLARVRITDQRRVRDRPQLEQEMPLLSFSTFSVLSRRTVPGALEMHVALSAAAARHKERTADRRA